MGQRVQLGPPLAPVLGSVVTASCLCSPEPARSRLLRRFQHPGGHGLVGALVMILSRSPALAVPVQPTDVIALTLRTVRPGEPRVSLVREHQQADGV